MLICCSGILLARVQGQQAKSMSPDRWQVFGGYTLQHTIGLYNGFAFNQTCEASDYGCDEYASFNSNGGQFAVSYFVRHHLGLTFQATFDGSGTRDVTYYAEDPPTQSINTKSYLFGPTFRYGIYGGKASLFGQVLVGVTHNTFNASGEYVDFCYNYKTESDISSCTTNNFTLPRAVAWISGSCVTSLSGQCRLSIGKSRFPIQLTKRVIPTHTRKKRALTAFATPPARWSTSEHSFRCISPNGVRPERTPFLLFHAALPPLRTGRSRRVPYPNRVFCG